MNTRFYGMTSFSGSKWVLLLVLLGCPMTIYAQDVPAPPGQDAPAPQPIPQPAPDSPDSLAQDADQNTPSRQDVFIRRAELPSEGVIRRLRLSPVNQPDVIRRAQVSVTPAQNPSAAAPSQVGSRTDATLPIRGVTREPSQTGTALSEPSTPTDVFVRLSKPKETTAVLRKSDVLVVDSFGADSTDIFLRKARPSEATALLRRADSAQAGTASDSVQVGDTGAALDDLPSQELDGDTTDVFLRLSRPEESELKLEVSDILVVDSVSVDTTDILLRVIKQREDPVAEAFVAEDIIVAGVPDVVIPDVVIPDIVIADEIITDSSPTPSFIEIENPALDPALLMNAVVIPEADKQLYPEDFLYMDGVYPELFSPLSATFQLFKFRFTERVDYFSTNLETIKIYGQQSGYHFWHRLDSEIDAFAFNTATRFLPGERLFVITTAGISGVEETLQTIPGIYEYRSSTDSIYTTSLSEVIIDDQARDASSVAVADMDGDGWLEVASASRADHSISVHENRFIGALGAFDKTLLTFRAFHAKDVSFADLDGDGDMDVISASEGDDMLAWYENLGNGQFTQENILSNDEDGIRKVIPIDFDADGDIDLVTMACLANEVRWFENRGLGEYRRRTIANELNDPVSVEVVDMDRDGDLDVVIASPGFGEMYWYVNQGDLTFRRRVISTQVRGVADMTVGDLDGDWYPDVVFSIPEANQISWLRSDSARSFQMFDITTTALEPGALHVADLTGNGFLDVLAATSESGMIPWYENRGFGIYRTRVLIPNRSVVSDITTGDMDGDGDVDVILTYPDLGKVAWIRVNPFWTVDDALLEQQYIFQSISKNAGAVELVNAEFKKDRRTKDRSFTMSYVEVNSPDPRRPFDPGKMRPGTYVVTVTRRYGILGRKSLTMEYNVEGPSGAMGMGMPPGMARMPSDGGGGGSATNGGALTTGAVGSSTGAGGRSFGASSGKVSSDDGRSFIFRPAKRDWDRLNDAELSRKERKALKKSLKEADKLAKKSERSSKRRDDPSSE